MRRIKIFITGMILASVVQAEDLWRFLLLADWHSAEKYTQTEKNPSWLAAAVAEDVATVSMLKANYGGELILMPGDSNGGHWDRPDFIQKNVPGATAEESILEAGRLCYSGMIDAFRDGGYSKLIMAVGDHEMGDNPWPPKSDKARCQPQFREAFAKEFNMDSDGGRFLYKKPIGAVASQPIGTPYENTSYAYRHKNVLFVTIDSFHQEHPDKIIGRKGSVTGTVVGEHLLWLNEVLSEARKDTGIKHILVQSHLPVIYPVRKVNSSGMLMDNGMDNPFWKTLQNYNVDIYFAGEVHANTVTQDPNSDVIQLVSRGNFFNNFQTLDITDERIDVVCYEQKVGTKSSEGDYSVSGTLTIDKSGPSTTIHGTGELAVLDVQSRLLHFSFEEDLALVSNPIMGLPELEKCDGISTLRRETCSRIFPNHGSFGKHYSALTANVDLVDGPHGKAGHFSANSRMGLFAMGPHHGGHAISYALWVQSVSPDNQILINSGKIWGKKLKNFFNLHLNNGRPEVVVSQDQRLISTGAALNDGDWHHLAVVMPADDCLLSKVLIYVDGKRAQTRINGKDLNLHVEQAVRLGFGGLNYSSSAFDALSLKPFIGAMDEISIWTRPLKSDEVVELSLSLRQ